MQINSVIIAGRLTKNIEYSATQDGTPAARFTLANTRKHYTNYFTVAAFGKAADYARLYLHKGQRVTVQGMLNHYTKKAAGSYKDYYTIIADTFDAIHPKSQQSNSIRDIYSKLDAITKKVDQASGTKRTKKYETKSSRAKSKAAKSTDRHKLSSK